MIEHIDSLYSGKIHAVEIRLSRSMSHAITENKSYYKAIFEHKSGTRITFVENKKESYDQTPLTIVGHGSIPNVRKLRDLVNELIRDCKLAHMGNLKGRSSAYFMENSTCIFVRAQMIDT
jgi:hypothetical protein